MRSEGIRDVCVCLHEYLTKPAFWRYDSMNVDDTYGIIIPLIYPMVIDLTSEVTKRDSVLLEILCCCQTCCRTVQYESDTVHGFLRS